MASTLPDSADTRADAERTAYEYVRQAAAEFHARTAVIMRQGGDLPYDGALEAFAHHVLALEGIRGVDLVPLQAPLAPAGITPSKALTVFAGDGYACRACGSTDDLTVDHVIPRAKGGGHELANLQTLCRSCNSRKGIR